jgi:hypothetical protein
MSYAAEKREHGTATAAAAARGITLRNFMKGLEREKKRDAKTKAEAPAPITFPKFSNPNAPIKQVIGRLAEDQARKAKRAAEEKWFRVHVRDKRPIGILWFGDPHLGTSTNWDALNRHVKHCATVKGLYGANIGDTTNNWVGSLMRLAAEEDISRKTERRLAKWFLSEAGITWFLWLMGNHDEWNEGADILRLMDIHNRVPMFDWSAKIELVFPNRVKIRVHAAHDFPGNSMWNSTHAPARAPRMLGGGADLYACGHKHTWGIQQFEMPDAGKCPTAIRVRGYKTGDHYAKRLGFPEDENGFSILTIFDPTAGPAGRVLSFADVDQGVKVLRSLRNGK